MIPSDIRPTRPNAPPAALPIPGYRHIQDAQALNRLTCNGNYTWVEFAGEKTPVLICQTLKYFERQLPDFLRVSKSILLNPDYVVSTRREGPKTLYLRLADETLILVSRRRLTEITEKLGRTHSPRKNVNGETNEHR